MRNSSNGLSIAARTSLTFTLHGHVDHQTAAFTSVAIILLVETLNAERFTQTDAAASSSRKRSRSSSHGDN
jgi:hypothetical protein